MMIFFELQFAKHPIQNIRDTGFPWECYNGGWFPIIVLDLLKVIVLSRL